MFLYLYLYSAGTDRGYKCTGRRADGLVQLLEGTTKALYCRCAHYAVLNVVPIDYKRQSSAKDLTWDLTHSGRSFMWHKNSSGPNTVACGTPESTWALSECSPSTTTLIERFVGMVIATDVYFLQFHSCVVYLRILCVVLCQRLLRNLVLLYLVGCCYRSFVVSLLS